MFAAGGQSFVTQPYRTCAESTKSQGSGQTQGTIMNYLVVLFLFSAIFGMVGWFTHIYWDGLELSTSLSGKQSNILHRSPACHTTSNRSWSWLAWSFLGSPISRKQNEFRPSLGLSQRLDHWTRGRKGDSIMEMLALSPSVSRFTQW